MTWDNVSIILLESLIGICIAYVIRILKLKFDNIRTSNVISWVEKAIEAAEQEIPESNSGDMKKEAVMQYILNRYNNKINIKDVHIIIGSYVYKMNKSNKQDINTKKNTA